MCLPSCCVTCQRMRKALCQHQQTTMHGSQRSTGRVEIKASGVWGICGGLLSENWSDAWGKGRHPSLERLRLRLLAVGVYSACSRLRGTSMCWLVPIVVRVFSAGLRMVRCLGSSPRCVFMHASVIYHADRTQFHTHCIAGMRMARCLGSCRGAGVREKHSQECRCACKSKMCAVCALSLQD